ncbi:hypothetical protein U472_14975 [Orenia metallireducens]|uniref:Translocation and assembly module TamB C-terminal domain-containing protein n=1 Tax=Orenia metallireducens TaxID=1413210 RepID=A0A1C0A660_9FIRM|nr:translocation/assembly module TamB domain-containing protein [Orenia metallireducens]OCL25630.1 hypothetical protein U472_14975 [Orenia metallireducens]
MNFKVVQSNRVKVIVLAIFFFMLSTSLYLLYTNRNLLFDKVKYEVINLLDKKLQMDIKIEDVKIKGINKILIEGIIIKDDHSNNLLEVEGIEVSYSIKDLIFKSFNPLKSITEVRVIRPDIMISKEGEWNFSSLTNKFTPSDKTEVSTSLEMKSSIYIEEGKLEYNTPEFKDKLTDISGRVDLAKEIKFDLEARLSSLSEKILELRGRIKDKSYEGELVFDGIKLSRIKDKFDISQLENISFKGDITGKADIKGVLGKIPNYSITLYLNDGFISKDDIDVTGVEGYFGINRYGVKVNKLVANYKKFPIEVSGEVFNWRDSQLNLEYNLADIPLEELTELLSYDDLQVKGNAKVSGIVKGELINPSVTAKVIMDKGSIKGATLTEFTSKFYYKDKVVNLEQLNFKYGKGSVSGRGTIAMDEGLNYILSTNINNIDLADLEELFDYQLDGIGLINGEAMVSGVGFDKNQLNILGNVTLTDGSVKDYVLNSLESNFWLTDGKLFLNHTELISNDTKVNLEGLVTLGGKLNLSLRGNNINLKKLNTIHQIEELDGIVDLSGEVRGTISKPDFKGKFMINKLTYGNFDIGGTFGNVGFNNNKLSLEDVRLVSLASEISGSIDFASNKSNIILDTKEIGVEKVLDILGVDLSFAGTAKGRTIIESLYPKLSLKGELLLSDGRIYGQNFDTANLEYAYRDGEFIIDNLETKYNNTILVTNGNYADNYLEINFNSDKLNLEDIDHYNLKEIGVIGDSEVEGRVYGKVPNLKVVAKVKSDSIKVNGADLGDISAKLSYKDQHLYLTNLLLESLENVYKMSGSLDIEEKRIKSLLLSVEQGDINYLNQFIPYDLDLPYKFVGQVRASGPMKEPVVNLDLLLSDENNIGYLDIKGNYVVNDDINIKLLAKEFDFTPINNLELIPYQLGGKINLTGQLTGTLDRLNFNSNIKVTDGKVNQFGYEQLVGQINLINGYKVSLNQTLQIKGNNVVRAEGNIPLNSSEEFHLDLELEEGNLSLLPLIVSDIKSATGKGRADIHLSGNWKSPKLTGEAEVMSGNISYPEVLDRDISNLSGKLNLTGEEIIIKDVKGRYGEGSFNIKGDVALDGIKPLNYNIKFSGKNIAFEHGFVQAKGNGDISITGPFAKPLIKGSLLVHDSHIDLGLDWPTAEKSNQGPLVQPSFDLSLTPGKNVRVGNNNIDILIQSGNLNLKNGEQGLELIGRLESTNGQISYYNTEFELEKGAATFNKYDLIPNLQVRAITEVKATPEIKARTGFNDVKIYLDLNGMATQMEPNIYSKPELTKEEIILLLTSQGGIGSFLEKDYEGALKTEVWRLIDENLQIELISKLEKSFEKSLDLDQFRIKSILSGDVRIELAKFVTDNLMLKYDHVFGMEEEHTYGFEYHFGAGFDNLLINGQYDSEEEYQLGVEASINF